MSKFKIEIKWAIIFLAMGLVWMVLEKAVGLHDVHIDKHPIYTNLVAIPSIAIFVFALLDKRKNHYNGSMTYVQSLVSGIVISVIIAVFSPLTQYIISTYITPDYFANAIKYSVEKGGSTQEKAEAFFNLENYMLQAVFGGLIMGVITSAIVSVFVRKK